MATRSAIRAPLDLSLLGLLDEGPKHGYELHRAFQRKSGLGLIWTLGQASLYAQLARFEAEGLVGAELVEREGGHQRRVFHLTARGRAALESWLACPSERRDFRLDFLAKLRFALERRPEAVPGLVERQREACDRWIGELLAKAAEAPDEDGLVYRYRLGQLEATAAWLADCAERYGAVPPRGVATRPVAARRARAGRRER